MSIKTKSGILLLILLIGWLTLIVSGFNHGIPYGIAAVIIPLVISLLIK